MPRPLKEIPRLPATPCPMCASKNLQIVRGGRFLFFRQADVIRCKDCKAKYVLASDEPKIRMRELGPPYNLFIENFANWVYFQDAALVGEMIRTGNPEAAKLLSGADVYLWRMRCMFGATDSLDIFTVDYEWSSVKSARRVLAEIRQKQRELRHIKREMNLDMKKIRAEYGRSKSVENSKRKALAPFENLGVVIDKALVNMDALKLQVQDWIEEERQV